MNRYMINYKFYDWTHEEYVYEYVIADAFSKEEAIENFKSGLFNAESYIIESVYQQLNG